MQLAAEIPAPVLGDRLGISPQTAVRWATHAARDWATYTALPPRRQPLNQMTLLLDLDTVGPFA